MSVELLVGGRLERVVVDRRFDQVVAWCETVHGAHLEVVYHRADLASFDLAAWRDAAECRGAIADVAVERRDTGGSHHLQLLDGGCLSVAFREVALQAVEPR